MLTLITILIAVTCVLLIAVVLIQNPKGGVMVVTSALEPTKSFVEAK